MEFSKIKLIIWDLDETLWDGVLSEGNIILSEQNKQLLNDMVDCGVMCSICSKNDENEARSCLSQYNIFDLFVFPSINWSPKGERVSQIVSEMNLRMTNVMFIDDNPSNRAEVDLACEGIDVEDIDIIIKLASYYKELEKTDIEHSRLKQYKVLEKKKIFHAKYATNEEFLQKSNITLNISFDCFNHIDRIYDLILRSNQLNFTKVRSNKEEIKILLEDKSIKAGYVSVKDNFGDYGIVGFYAIKANRLIHYVFSCRTLGMGIEQYVYKFIGKPKLKIIGAVSSDVNSPEPHWIQENENKRIDEKSKLANGKIIIKGPCDMSQMFTYISDNKNIITEFVYINNSGVSIEQGNHTTHIVESHTLDVSTKKRLIENLPFGDNNMFTTAIFNNDVKFVVLSLFTDPNLGLYKEKKSGGIVAFGEYTNDLTDCSKWKSYIDKSVFVANCSFTIDNLNYIKDNYEYIGRLKPDDVIKNLIYIYNNISLNTQIILILGSEIKFIKEKNEAYLDRHKYNKELNQKVKLWAAGNKRISIIDVNKFIVGQESFSDNINHFVRLIYYQMSCELISIINNDSSNILKHRSKILVIFNDYSKRIKEKIFTFLKILKI